MAIRKTVTLAAGTAQTVTLAGIGDSVEVVNLGADNVYFRFDGTAATVKGDDCFVVTAGGSDVEECNDNDLSVGVSVISATSQDVHVGLRNVEI